VRQLRNVLERAALLCDGQEIECSHVERALGVDTRPERRAARSRSIAA
jgi:DNA-binding NtrC family response regulator